MSDLGWIDSAPERQHVRDAMRATGHQLSFEFAAKDLIGAGFGKTVVLHTFGKLPAQKQTHPTGVSRAVKRAMDLLQYIETGECKPVSQAAIYGTCRMHANMLKAKPGAVAAWAAWAVINTGNISLEDDSDEVAMKYGAHGVPVHIITNMSNEICRTFTQAKSADNVRDAIVSLKPVVCGSRQGFTAIRNEHGFCIPDGVWNQCLAITGYRHDKDAFLFDQSIGELPGGPMGDIEIPSYSFWVDRRTVERMVAQDDTWIFTGASGWNRPNRVNRM
jgi:hypothetical protein